MLRLFFNDAILALFGSFLMAVMPLTVFFSRNIQPESPGFFFMILGNLFYLKFISSGSKRALFLGGLSFVMAWLYKFSFFIGVAPFIFCMPYREIFKDKGDILKKAVAFLSPFMIMVATILWLKHVGQWKFAVFHRLNLIEIFTPSYWAVHGGKLIWYTRGENFTLTYIVLALGGIILPFVKYCRRLITQIYSVCLSILLALGICWPFPVNSL